MMKNFLFVNKNADSFSLSSTKAREKNAISSFVQKGRRHPRGGQALGSLGVPQFNFKFRRRGECDITPQCRDINQAQIPGSECQIPREPETGKELLDSCSGRLNLANNDDVSEPDSTMERHQEQSISMICQQGNPVDPFNAFSIKLDPQICDLLQIYAAYSNRHETPDLRPSQLIQECLFDDFTMHTVLAGMAGLRINLEGLPLQCPTGRYLHHAIISTRRNLASNPVVDVRLIKGVFYMAYAEWNAFRSDAAITHLKVAKVLVDQCGGWDNLPLMLIESLLDTDWVIAFQKRTTPVFPCTFDPGPNPSGLAWMGARSTPNNMGQGLLGPGQHEIVPKQLRTFILDLADCITVAAFVADPENPESYWVARRWMSLRYLALRYRLITMKAIDPRSAAIRAALITWFVTVLLVDARKPAIRIPSRLLGSILRGIEASAWSGHESVLLWILVVGEISSIRDSDCQKEFAKEISNLLNDRGVVKIFASADPLIQLSKTFFYWDLVERPWLERLAKEIGCEGPSNSY